MEYSKDINPRMVAYCNDIGYETLEERWETDKGNHKFTSWMHDQRRLFYYEQTGESIDDFKGDQRYQLSIFIIRNINLFDLWLTKKYPHKT